MSFLQGLVSNDVTAAAPGRAAWAAFLTPQGKYLADFFIFSDGERFLLDVERLQLTGLVQRLNRFRLRSKVTVCAREELLVYVAWGDEAPGEAAVTAADPRLPAAGWRLIARQALPTNASTEEWDRHRLSLGLPDGTRDLEPDKTILLEAGFDELNGISWTKGCYMGQELTARTKYRGLVKRRLMPVVVEGPMPKPGSAVMRGDVEVGTMRSGRDALGLAVLRLDTLDAVLTSDGARLTPRVPPWMRLAEHAN